MEKKKTHGLKLAAPKTTKRRTKQKKTQKVKCLYFMGIYLARQLLGSIQGVQPQILWLIVRHYAVSFRGPNCSFQYHVGISFRTESQCDYPCRLSLKKLKVFMIREQRRGRKKQKAIFENSILQFNFLQLLSCFLFQNGVFQGSIKFSTHPGGSHLGV